MDFSEFLLDKTSYGVRLREKNSLTQINPWWGSHSDETVRFIERFLIA